MPLKVRDAAAAAAAAWTEASDLFGKEPRKEPAPPPPPPNDLALTGGFRDVDDALEVDGVDEDVRICVSGALFG